MFTTAIAVIPKHIRPALADVLDYVIPAEADDFRATPKARLSRPRYGRRKARRFHIKEEARSVNNVLRGFSRLLVSVE
jgi:hypothetical protein